MLIIFIKILFFSRYFMKNEILTEFKKYGAIPTNILIPDHFVDLKKWAVVACDQYTSQKDYWKDVEDFCKGSPSTDNLIFPECYLEDDDKEERIKRINQTMQEYLDNNIFKHFSGCIKSFTLVTSIGSIGNRHFI